MYIKNGEKLESNTASSQLENNKPNCINAGLLVRSTVQMLCGSKVFSSTTRQNQVTTGAVCYHCTLKEKHSLKAFFFNCKLRATRGRRLVSDIP